VQIRLTDDGLGHVSCASLGYRSRGLTGPIAAKFSEAVTVAKLCESGI